MVLFKARLVYWVGVALCGAVTWLVIRELHGRAAPPVLPMLGNLFWDRAYGALWAAGLGGGVFGLVARTLQRDVTVIPRSSTLFLAVLTILWAAHLCGQAYGARAELYHIDVSLSVLSMLSELMILSTVWALWAYARRAPSWWRRTAFSGSIAVYFACIWRGSGVWFYGP
jgi:hypothetical protein